jgi:hypothetical protein
MKPDYREASELVLSRERAFEIDRSCRSVTDDHPSQHAFGVDEVLFIRCPSEYLRVGSSGSVLAILSPDETWSLGAQIVAGGIGEPVRAGAGEGTEPRDPLGQQILLGNVPMFRQTMTIVYLKELIRRGVDPRHR